MNKKKQCGFYTRMMASLIDGIFLGIMLFPFSILSAGLIYNKNYPSMLFEKAFAEAINTQHFTKLSEALKYVFHQQQIHHYLFDEYGIFKIILDQTLQFIFCGFIILLFWKKKQATPGKIILGIKIVDYQSGNTPTMKQYIYRFLGYFISTIPLFFGFFWIIFDKNKRAWHDYLSKTKVVFKNNPN